MTERRAREDRDLLETALEAMRAWGERRAWRGYDPYDALASPLAPVLTLGTALGRRLFTQAVKLSPVNVRPILGIRPALNATTAGYLVSAYSRLHRASGEERAREQAHAWARWLATNTARDGGRGWAIGFDVQTRFFFYEGTTPNTVTTSFVSHALMDAVEILGDADSIPALRGAIEFLLSQLETSGEGTFFRYVPHDAALIHNANLLACSVLARAAPLVRDDEYVDIAAAASRSSLAAQRPDGSWPYSDIERHGWVDNVHTGYVLESLAVCAASIPDVAPHLTNGADYWERNLFLPDGTPKYFAEQAFPLDAHSYTQAIETWLALEPWREDALEQAERTARLLCERMQDPSGYLYFQQRRLWRHRVPFVRWSTAAGFKALARLLCRIRLPSRA